MVSAAKHPRLSVTNKVKTDDEKPVKIGFGADASLRLSSGNHWYVSGAEPPSPEGDPPSVKSLPTKTGSLPADADKIAGWVELI